MEPLLQEVWLSTESWEWGGLNLGNLSQKTSREAVHTFCISFHLSPVLCSVRIQQCQLRDICHPLSLGIVELESRKTHLWRQPSLTALVENVVWRPVLSAGKDSVSLYFWSLMFFSCFNMEKISQVWAQE